MMTEQKKRVVLCLCIAIIFISGGCTQKPSAPSGQQSSTRASHTASMLMADTRTFTNVPVYKERDGLVWVPLEETAKSMNWDVHYTDGRYAIGHTDAAYSIKVDQTQAMAGDKQVELPQAPRLIDHKLYMTTQALSALMGAAVNWSEQTAVIAISPVDDRSSSSMKMAEAPATSLPSNTKWQLVQFAHTLVGTPYEFSSGPYDRTRTFDCSSFVQYVYGKFGVELPRSSRSQGDVGQTVAAEQLQPGDLMFFYTPGRFASNRTVGHVGIYAGNGQLIHTFGSPGVTVSEFTSYWKGRFLFAKRV